MRTVYVAVVLIVISFLIATGLNQPQRMSGSGGAPTPDFIVAQTHEFAPHITAFGQVEPVTIVAVAAAEGGVLEGLAVRPGAHVRTGEELAHLSGPAIASLLTQSRADVRSAQTQLNSAQKALTIAQQQLPSHLATRQMVQQAEATVAQSRTALENAESKLQAARQMTIITAPSSGTVLALSGADGALVSAGQTIVSIQPDGGLWLQATVYGSDMAAVRIGMRGQFAPANGRAAVPVHIVAIPGTIQAGGGEQIALEPEGSRIFHFNGEAGMVALDLPARPMVAVPTRALIMSQGKWWLLVHTARGDQPRQVVPGPVEGWNTWIESGLAPGTKVVVNDVYLLFHAGIAAQFQLPD